ncbi:hypothetical protein RUND412_009291 [Rhizina undulata]
MVIPATGLVITEFFKPGKTFFKTLLSAANRQSPPVKKKSIYLAIFNSYVLATLLVFFIIGTELVLKRNHIYGVSTLTSTGQILPVVLAVASIVRVVFQALDDPSPEVDRPLTTPPLEIVSSDTSNPTQQ